MRFSCHRTVGLQIQVDINICEIITCISVFVSTDIAQFHNIEKYEILENRHDTPRKCEFQAYNHIRDTPRCVVVYLSTDIAGSHNIAN